MPRETRGKLSAVAPTPWSKGSTPGDQVVPVTAVVLAYNEIANIERCLETLGWVSQIVVVDSGSDDGTAAAAGKVGATVLEHEFVDFADQRNWALGNEVVANDWVLMVDADNWVSESLAQEIESVIRQPAHDCYMVRLRLIWQGTWIRYAGWYSNSWQERLFLRSSGSYVGIHSERFVTTGPVGFLRNDLIDEDIKPFERWLAKHNHYSTLVAEQRYKLRRTPVLARLGQCMQARPRRRIPRELAKRLVLPAMPGKGLWVFLYMFIMRGGFLHGRVGFWFCALHAGQQVAIDVKVSELERGRMNTGD